MSHPQFVRISRENRRCRTEADLGWNEQNKNQIQLFNLKFLIVWSVSSTIWSTFEEGIYDFVFSFYPNLASSSSQGGSGGLIFLSFVEKSVKKTWKDPKNMNLLFWVKFNLFIYCVRSEADMQWSETIDKISMSETNTDQIWSKKKK